MKNEEPPNKDVHAEDLATALAKLHAKPQEPASPVSPMDWENGANDKSINRERSGSITIYHPKDHSDHEDLPTIAVEDTTGSPEPMPEIDESADKPITHTARPPVELLEDA